jgi:hypothetical protein
MEGHKLILKRKIPKGRQQLAALLVGAFVVVVVVAVGQLKTTLSAQALAAVRGDFTEMKTQFSDATASPLAPSMNGGGVATAPAAVPATPADEAVEKFKKLIQDVPVKE